MAASTARRGAQNRSANGGDSVAPTAGRRGRRGRGHIAAGRCALPTASSYAKPVGETRYTDETATQAGATRRHPHPCPHCAPNQRLTNPRRQRAARLSSITQLRSSSCGSRCGSDSDTRHGSSNGRSGSRRCGGGHGSDTGRGGGSAIHGSSGHGGRTSRDRGSGSSATAQRQHQRG